MTHLLNITVVLAVLSFCTFGREVQDKTIEEQFQRQEETVKAMYELNEMQKLYFYACFFFSWKPQGDV